MECCFEVAYFLLRSREARRFLRSSPIVAPDVFAG